MLLSCPAKKVTKECGIGEALRLGAHLRARAGLCPVALRNAPAGAAAPEPPPLESPGAHLASAGAP